MKRRDFLGTAVLSAGMLAANGVSGTAAEQDVDNKKKSQSKHDLSQWIQLTKNVKCPRIGFGTGMRGWQRNSDLTRLGWKDGITLLNHAYDLGVRFFDCADLYGTHFMLAEAMKGKPRESYVIATKLWTMPGGLPEKERLDPSETVPRLLRELNVDYIDIVQIHCVSNPKWSYNYANTMNSLAKLKEKGIIRAHGVSTHSNAAVECAANSDWCDVIHARLNSEGMNMDGPKDNAELRVKESIKATQKAHGAGKGIIAIKVLGEGKMSNNPELRKKSTKFIFNLDCVDVLIAGFTEKQHVNEFLQNCGYKS
ncbi:MAG: aldo/keto reductase [Planctomycetaceae bacterium]|jgi:aryl-alcohol dehydrogenase-like predicted oxidoreductase|nr:aldo/keto reductase [Planctomycetaceae bacterium]